MLGAMKRAALLAFLAAACDRGTPPAPPAPAEVQATPGPEEVRPPGPADEAKLAAARADLAALRARYAPGTGPIDAAALDAIHAGGSAAEGEKLDAARLVAALGTGLGDLLAAEAGMRWIVVKDPLGEDLAVVKDPGDVRVYPWKAVEKRVAAKEPPSFAALVPRMLRKIRDTSAAHAAAQRAREAGGAR